MRFAGVSLAFYLICCFANISGAQEAGDLARLHALHDKLQKVQSIYARFEQVKQIDFLNDPLPSEGFFYFSRPNSLYWEYEKPLPSGLEIQGAQARAWTGCKGQRQNQPEALAQVARLAAGQVMIWMSFDLNMILPSFDVSITNNDPLILRVTPKRETAAKFIHWLEVHFSSDERMVEKVIIKEPDSLTRLKFRDILLNQPRPF